MGQIVTFKRPDGADCKGYLSGPAGNDNAPGIVVIQEWWGLNDQIKGVADRFSALGYRALAPDLYKGKVTLDAAEAGHLMTSLNFGDAATQDIRGAAQYLKQTSAKVGVVGFCMGGALTVVSAMYVPGGRRILLMVRLSPRRSGRCQKDKKTVAAASCRKRPSFFARERQGFGSEAGRGQSAFRIVLVQGGSCVRQRDRAKL